MRIDTFGRQAYQSYGEHVGWTSPTGAAMMRWEDLPDDIRVAWQVAAVRVVDCIMSIVRHQLLGGDL